MCEPIGQGSAARILIAGGPRTGKTTLAAELASRYGLVSRSTDDLADSLGWSDASVRVAEWLDEQAPWIIEGVAVPRALRKWLSAHNSGAPASIVYWLTSPKVTRTKGQITMAKGCETVWWEVLPELCGRGVKVEVLR